MTTITAEQPNNDSSNDTAGVGQDAASPKPRWFGRLFAKRRRHRLARRLRPRGLRRRLKQLDLSEPQLDCALRVQQQLDALRTAADQQRRQLSWQLLAVVLDPEQQRQTAMRSMQQLTRTVDDKAAELIMTLAEFGEQLSDQQRQQLKRWLVHA